MPSGQKYNPATAGLSQNEVAWLKAYLNGSHNDNYVRCLGAPSSTGTNTVTRHCMVTRQIAADANGVVSLIVTGIPEAPLVVLDTFANVPNVYQYNTMPGPDPNLSSAPSPDFLKLHGIESYRCVSLALKMVDETAEIQQRGNIMSTRVPGGVDLVPFGALALDALWGTRTPSVRAVDLLPIQESDLTSVNSNVYTGFAKDGLYATIPAIDPLLSFIHRDTDANKAVYTQAGNYTDVNATILGMQHPLGVKLGTTSAIRLPKIGGGAPSVSLKSDGLIAASPSNMMSQIVFANGLSTVAGNVSTFRVTVMSTWEFVIGAGSDLGDQVRPPLPTNFAVLAMASQVFREMPVAYPASANFWNEIWEKAKDVYSNYISPLAEGAIKALPPQYAAGAGGIKAILDAVTRTEKKADKAAATAEKASSTAERASSATNAALSVIARRR